LGIVLHARSCAMGGEDVVGEVKGVEEVGVGRRCRRELLAAILVRDCQELNHEPLQDLQMQRMCYRTSQCSRS